MSPISDDSNELDKVVEVMANAMYDNAVERTRTLTAKVDLRLDRIRPVFETTLVEADRSAAILLFALAEDLMIDGFKRHLSGEVTGGWKAITSANGVLATANDRITILRMLYWIRSSTYYNIKILKDIRNLFAHHADISDCSDKRIRSRIDALAAVEKDVLSIYSSGTGKKVGEFSSRELFLVRASAVIVDLVCDLAALPYARRERVNPADVIGSNFDSIPPNLRDGRRLVAETIFKVFEGRVSETMRRDHPAVSLDSAVDP